MRSELVLYRQMLSLEGDCGVPFVVYIRQYFISQAEEKSERIFMDFPLKECEVERGQREWKLRWREGKVNGN